MAAWPLLRVIPDMGQVVRVDRSAAALRERAVRYRTLAGFYAGEVAAIILDTAADLDAEADCLEAGSSRAAGAWPSPDVRAISSATPRS